MKFLRSQGIVIVLALVAVILVYKNLIHPHIGRRVSAKTSAKTPAKTASKAPAKSNEKSTVGSKFARESGVKKEAASGGGAEVALPVAGIVMAEAQAHSVDWSRAPKRDPFHVAAGGKQGPSARDVLKLTGVVRQTESTLAVLNNKVVSKGETILGFRVEKVDGDRVWVSGPYGHESLEFKHPVPAEEEEVAASGAELSMRAGTEWVSGSE